MLFHFSRAALSFTEQVLQGFISEIAQDLVGPGKPLFGTDADGPHPGCFDGLDPGVGILNSHAGRSWRLDQPGGKDKDVRFRLAAYNTIAVGDAIKVGDDLQAL